MVGCELLGCVACHTKWFLDLLVPYSFVPFFLACLTVFGWHWFIGVCMTSAWY